MPKRIIRETSGFASNPMLSGFLNPASLDLLAGSGASFIQQIGLDVIRDILLDILTGKNLRDSTESLTRRRITALNLAIVSLFLKGSERSPDFVSQLPYLASDILASKGISKADRWLSQWILGLTDKAVQNVLRDNKALIETYRDRYIQACQEIIDTHKNQASSGFHPRMKSAKVMLLSSMNSERVCVLISALSGEAILKFLSTK
jgi:hypothetical protein